MPDLTASVPAAPLTSGVDVLILCALQDELDAVLELGEGGRDRWSEQPDGKGFRYYRRTIDNGRGGQLRVAAAWAGEMGAVVAASRAQQLIGDLDPACVSMCGICAGDRTKVALGDVIIADQLYRYDEGKVVAPEGKPAETFHSLRTFDLEATWKMDAAFLRRELDFSGLRAARPRSRASQRRWLLDALLAQEEGGAEVVSHLDRKERVPDWTAVVKAAQEAGLLALRGGKLSLTEEGRELALNEQVLYPDGLPEDPPFEVRIGAIATGAAVQEDARLFDRLRRLLRTTLGVEMEGAALGEVAQRFGRRMLLVKAVSDHADEEKDDSFRGFACRASATVLVELLKRLVEPGQRPADFKALTAYAGVLEEAVDQRFEEENKRASQLFAECRYAEAREAYEQIRAQAEPLAEHASAVDRPALRRWVEQCKLNVAAAMISMQEHEQARPLLLDILPDMLPIDGKIMLAEGLAIAGEHERARALMPPASGLPPEEERMFRRALQLFEMLDGHVPEDLEDSPVTFGRAAVALLNQGDLAGAMDRALLSADKSDGHPLILANTIQLCVEALRRSIYELPPLTTKIRSEELRSVLDILDDYFGLSDVHEALPEKLRAQMRAVERTYQNITGYTDWMGPAGEGPDEGERGGLKADPLSEALRSASSKETEEALRALPADDHPWRGRFNRVQILAVTGSRDRALDEALALAHDFPDRAPVERIVAQLCAGVGRSKDALAHATRAHELLPSKGYRVLLASQHLDNDQPGEAWALMENIRDDQPGILRVRMVAAEQTGHWLEAERDWGAFVMHRPEDAAARVSYAQLLFRMDLREKAAAVGWSVYEEHRDKLDAERMYVCAWLQRMNDALGDDLRRERIGAIAAEIKRRFSGNVNAERLWTSLVAMLGAKASGETSLTESDLDLLVANGLATKGEGLGDLTALLQRRQDQFNTLTDWARRGFLPVTAVADVTQTPLSLLVARLVEMGPRAPLTPCPPLVSSDVLPVLDLSGAHIVVSGIEFVILEALDLMDPLRKALGPAGQLVLLPSALNRLHRDFSEMMIDTERDELAQIDARAANLATRTHRRLGEGWVYAARAPDVSDLPPLRAPDEPLADMLFVEPVKEVIEERRLLLENPTWWRLSAELYGSVALGNPQVMLRFAWPNQSALRTVAEPLGPTTERDLTLPVLIRLLNQAPGGLQPKSAEAKLLQLAGWGFGDALGAGEILGLVRRFDDLGGAEPRRILDAAEWMAHEPDHIAGRVARGRLAYAYGAAIFNAFINQGVTDAHRKSLLGTLLHRQEMIGEKSTTNALDMTFSVIASATAEHWQAAFKPIDETRGVIDTNGPIARLWRALHDWSGRSGPRSFALGRALDEVWGMLSVEPGGPPMHVIAALDLIQWPAQDKGQPAKPASARFGLEAYLILSSLWREDPFKESAFSGPIEQGKEALVGRLLLPDGRFPVIVREGADPEFVPVPVEALLLRADVETRRDAAAWIKLEQGRHDGECYSLLSKIERAPDDGDLLRRYARHASTALFRLVRDDPPFLTVWGQALRLGENHGSRFKELLDIISEPAPPLPERSLGTLMVERVEEGIWSDGDHGRRDGAHLFLPATEVPGILAASGLNQLLNQDSYDDDVRSYLHEIEHAEEEPIARVVRAVFFLRLASVRQPYVKLPEGEVDLREILPSLLERLLENVINAPPRDTYATTEAPLLRVCGDVIQRLARPMVLSVRDELWLTWRLFQWLCLQLDAIAPDARVDGIRRLMAHAPPPQARRDVLDPHGFGRDHPERFDHRLGAVLHALGAMEELVAVFDREDPPERHIEPRRVSSPALEDRLVQLAQRVHLAPPVGSVLDWHGPDNVPDLALNALLRLSRARFADLSPESRTRRFNALPEDPQALAETNPSALEFTNHILLAVAETAARLTPEERTLLENKLHAMADGSVARRWRWRVFVSLFETGASHLEAEAQTLVIEHVKDPRAAVSFGRLLLGIAALDPARVEPAMEAVISAAIKQDADAGALAAGALGRLLVHGSSDGKKVAAALILKLADREEFRENRGMQEVIGFFRLRDAQV